VPARIRAILSSNAPLNRTLDPDTAPWVDMRKSEGSLFRSYSDVALAGHRLVAALERPRRLKPGEHRGLHAPAVEAGTGPIACEHEVVEARLVSGQSIS
jgi:hypothetical protein